MTRDYPDRPIVGVAAVVIEDDRVVLVRRGRPPAYGEWSLPGGAVEPGETLEEAVVREVAEEIGFNVEVVELVAVLDRIFLQALKINLSKVIGPMSEILIEEVVSEMELTSPGIPVDQAAELISSLSHEIPDEEKRIEFKKSMMDILNTRRT